MGGSTASHSRARINLYHVGTILLWRCAGSSFARAAAPNRLFGKAGKWPWEARQMEAKRMPSLVSCYFRSVFGASILQIRGLDLRAVSAPAKADARLAGAVQRTPPRELLPPHDNQARHGYTHRYIYIYGPVFRVATPPPPPHMVWVPQAPPPPDTPAPPPPGQANPRPTINQP